MVTTATVAAWITRYAAIIDENEALLTELDSPIGDADHGANMARGMAAAVPGIDAVPTIDAQLKQVGMAMLSKVGGTSGPLYGTLFLRAAMALGARAEVASSEFAEALATGAAALAERGKADPGDKTMVDALAPAVAALERALSEGHGFADAAAAAFEAADAGREATTPMLARKGRASYLGERSVGHTDPGATSAAYLFRALQEVA
ncbi:MAG: dihydroxyacetone kinase subunit L [Propionibacterium sp.]|nr:dihydroxyacetone kinase subunit L [Propionibacterium sp.]